MDDGVALEEYPECAVEAATFKIVGVVRTDATRTCKSGEVDHDVD
jgi:hypothetical protein